MGPFPAGVILHSYLGSAEMVPEFAKLGAYFSFSAFLMSMNEKKAKKMLKAVRFSYFSTPNYSFILGNGILISVFICRFLLIGSYWKPILLMHYQRQRQAVSTL